MVNWKGYLPDFKGVLKGFYEENIKETLENKTTYYENLLKENIVFSQRTQKIIIALGIGMFILLAIAFFWKEENQPMKNLKYIALGILVSYLGLYVLELSRTKLGTKGENKNN